MELTSVSNGELVCHFSCDEVFHKSKFSDTQTAFK